MIRLATLVLLRAALLVLTGVAVCATMARPAPIPMKAKKPSFAHLVGSWRLLLWSSGTGRAILHKEGGWECHWCGAWWTGRWTFEGDVLTVTESPEAPAPGAERYWMTWQARLDKGKTCGRLIRNGQDLGGFSLAPLPKGEKIPARQEGIGLPKREVKD
jgi:hypothetical protein